MTFPIPGKWTENQSRRKKITPENGSKISEIIAPSFYDLHHDMRDDLYSEYWLKGGRGSTKSSFTSIEIIKGMMDDPEANAVITRRYQVNLRDTVFGQIEWAILKLNVQEDWKIQTSPMQAVYKPTGQKIVFRGADDPKKLKSIKLARGYIKYAWFEEVDEYGGNAHLRNVLQSLFRGEETGKRISIFSYNPPKSSRSWVNQEVKVPKVGRRVHHSDYRSVNPKWLGEYFIAEAEHLKATNETAYRHEYLGEEVGTGLEVFNNINIRTITEDEISAMVQIRQGLDFGYAVDPLWFGETNYNNKKRRVYIFNEITGIGLLNRVFAGKLTSEQKNRLTIADSAEPKSIAELSSDYGLYIIPCIKGPGSVEHGIKWLQDREEIIIDPITAPYAAKEFTNYCLEIDRNGNVISKYPDKENHAQDACRYSLQNEIRSGGRQKVGKVGARQLGL